LSIFRELQYDETEEKKDSLKPDPGKDALVAEVGKSWVPFLLKKKFPK